jgi:hypothetical protein
MNFGKTRSSNTALRNFWVAESNNTSRRKVRSTCESHPRETPWLCCHRCDSGFVDVGVQGRVPSSGALPITTFSEKLLERPTSGYTPYTSRGWGNPWIYRQSNFCLFHLSSFMRLKWNPFRKTVRVLLGLCKNIIRTCNVAGSESTQCLKRAPLHPECTTDWRCAIASPYLLSGRRWTRSMKRRRAAVRRGSFPVFSSSKNRS